MNKQRKVLITTTYNEMGIIVDTKAGEVAQPVAKDINVPANDCISRAQAIEAIKEDKIDLTDPNVVAVFKTTGDFEKVETQVMTCDRHIKILKGLPSAQKKGHWIDEKTSYSCSECHGGCWVNSNYCPWCGADMRGENDG